MERRLAAILAADMVGFSRLVATDEAGTLERQKQYRGKLIDPTIASFGGRIFKTTGDGILAEFPSIVDAVHCALKIQQAMPSYEDEEPEVRRIRYRIGINLGDIVLDAGDVFGDGVNIAARLEALAEPGGICLADSAQQHLQGRIEARFEDMGEQTLKNIDRKIRVWGWPESGPTGKARSEHLPSNLSRLEKPTIALLPFINRSNDPAHEFIADSITENIITGLSKFRDLFVISSASTFAYKGKAVRIQDVSRELGVQYLLEGSVQTINRRIRITVQLIESDTGRQIWAEHYDRDADDIFSVQDEVTDTIVGTLATGYGGRLRKAWQGRALPGSARDPRSYDYFQRGINHFNLFSRDDLVKARECFHKAIELDPNFARPYAKISWAHICDVYLGWSRDPTESSALALDFARRAIAQEDDDAWGYWALAGYHQFIEHSHDRAIAVYKKALELNPNDADVICDYSLVLSHAGRPEEGIEQIRKAMRLNPHYPEWWTWQFGQILFDARRYQEAISALESLQILDVATAGLYLAASRAALGQLADARKALDRVISQDSGVTLQRCTSPDMAPYKDPKDREHFRENLRKAGLPDT